MNLSKSKKPLLKTTICWQVYIILSVTATYRKIVFSASWLMCFSYDFITIILYKEPEHQPHHFFSGTEVSAQAGFLSPSSLNCLFSNMGPRVLLLLALGLVILTDCIQGTVWYFVKIFLYPVHPILKSPFLLFSFSFVKGVHETKKQSLVVSAFTDGMWDYFLNTFRRDQLLNDSYRFVSKYLLYQNCYYKSFKVILSINCATGSAVGKLLTTARPVIQRQDKRPCTCKGDMRILPKNVYIFTCMTFM